MEGEAEEMEKFLFENKEEDIEAEVEETATNVVKEQNGTSFFGTVFLIVNAALGAGLLNFPKAFDEAGGITVAIAVQVALLLFLVVALNILAYSSDQNSTSPASTIEGN